MHQTVEVVQRRWSRRWSRPRHHPWGSQMQIMVGAKCASFGRHNGPVRVARRWRKRPSVIARAAARGSTRSIPAAIACTTTFAGHATFAVAAFGHGKIFAPEGAGAHGPASINPGALLRNRHNGPVRVTHRWRCRPSVIVRAAAFYCSRDLPLERPPSRVPVAQVVPVSVFKRNSTRSEYAFGHQFRQVCKISIRIGIGISIGISISIERWQRCIRRWKWCIRIRVSISISILSRVSWGLRRRRR